MANKLGSENVFPIIRILEDATPPSTPPTGQVHFYVDEATKTLHGLDDAAVDTDYGVTAVTEITDLPTAETDDTLRLAPDGAGGVEWVAGGGGGGDYTFIEEVTVGAGGLATVDIDAIPGTYRDLVIIVRARLESASDGESIRMRVGETSVDTGGNYAESYSYTGWTSGSGGTGTDTDFVVCIGADSQAAAGAYAYAKVELFGYADGAAWPGFQTRSYSVDGAGILRLTGEGLWKNAADPVDIIRFFASSGDIAEGSRFTVYGRG
jgi:hypothetical protein